MLELAPTPDYLLRIRIVLVLAPIARITLDAGVDAGHVAVAKRLVDQARDQLVGLPVQVELIVGREAGGVVECATTGCARTSFRRKV